MSASIRTGKEYPLVVFNKNLLLYVASYNKHSLLNQINPCSIYVDTEKEIYEQNQLFNTFFLPTPAQIQTYYVTVVNYLIDWGDML